MSSIHLTLSTILRHRKYFAFGESPRKGVRLFRKTLDPEVFASCEKAKGPAFTVKITRNRRPLRKTILQLQTRKAQPEQKKGRRKTNLELQTDRHCGLRQAAIRKKEKEKGKNEKRSRKQEKGNSPTSETRSPETGESGKRKEKGEKTCSRKSELFWHPTENLQREC